MSPRARTPASPARRSAPGALPRLVAVLLVALPLALAGVLAAGGARPLHVPWPAGSAAEAAPPPIDVARVQEARRALAEAATAAGFLDAALAEAGEGIGELDDGAGRLADGMGALRAGTAEIGEGARGLADGLDAGTEGVSLAAVAAGQVQVAAARARESLQGIDDPAAEDALADIESLERQLAAVDFAALDAELGRARDGARSMAEEVAGSYASGVAEAADGSRRLADGIAQLRGGQERLAGMSGNIGAALDTAQRTMPAPTAEQMRAAGMGGAGDPAPEPAAPATPDWAVPYLAALLAGAVAAVPWLWAGAPGRPGPGAGRGLLAWAAATALGAVALLAPAAPGSTPAAILAVGVLALAAAASAVVAGVLVRALGARAGRAALLAGLLAQAVVVAVVWRGGPDQVAAAAEAGGAVAAQPAGVIWRAAAAAGPLQHAVAALAAITGPGPDAVWLAGAAVTAAVAALGAVGLRLLRTAPAPAGAVAAAPAPAAEPAEPAPEPEPAAAEPTATGAGEPAAAGAGDDAPTTELPAVADPDPESGDPDPGRHRRR
ncbi:hypothetical protein [Corynebacterium sphenisci]|uniref:hypothetical protein n=1 Tax=Corynebacterium sphenisci TaxID=191493 RepID=UPI0026E0FFF9|nr:hypothetical protein [Corynebacterium sphenisci]MDO5730952.1 hypothetical protein [Corynebacterium sphenisci]